MAINKKAFIKSIKDSAKEFGKVIVTPHNSVKEVVKGVKELKHQRHTQKEYQRSQESYNIRKKLYDEQKHKVSPKQRSKMEHTERMQLEVHKNRRAV